jgi:hypothetical protein
MTPLRVSIIAAIASLLLLVIVFELIRSHRLRERYALLWLLTATVSLVLALWRDGLGKIADAAGISYPPSALFVLVSIFLLLVLLHYSTVISQLSDESRILAQRLALLEGRLAEQERAKPARAMTEDVGRGG